MALPPVPQSEQSLVKEQVRYGWTTCDVQGLKTHLMNAPAMVGGTTTVATMRMLELFVKVTPTLLHPMVVGLDILINGVLISEMS